MSMLSAAENAATANASKAATTAATRTNRHLITTASRGAGPSTSGHGCYDYRPLGITT